MKLRPVAIDVTAAAAAFAVSAAVLAGSRPVAADLRSPDAGAYVLLAVFCASVVLRRRAPAAATLVGLLAGVAFAAAQYPAALTPIVLLPVYTAAAVLPPRRGRVLLVAALVLGMAAAAAAPGPTDLGVPAFILSAWLLGRYVGTRRSYTAELEHKNRLLEQAQRDLAARAVAEERLRIARELHDVVAHTMSVVAVHAGTGRLVAEDDPTAAGQALATIETASRSALHEMRRLLGVLRRPGDGSANELGPAPGLGDLDGLVARVVQSGVAVEVRIEGERRELPAGVDLSAYRIVQEALTNVIKHGGRSPTTVTVEYAPDAVTVEIANEGAAPSPSLSLSPSQSSSLSPSLSSSLSPPAAPSPAAAHGLVGMRERVATYGGHLDAGPLPTGGYRVAARLPYGTPA